jgi:HIV Tat-specific factor 1
MAEHKEKAAKRQAAEQQKQGWFDLKVNTSVYITGLPDDTTPAEVCAFFSKCGIVKLGDDGQPRIKLYK